MATNRQLISAVAAATALVTAACSGSGTGAADVLSDKAGNVPPAVTLTLVTSEIPGRPGADMVERFVAAVDELSDGRVSVVATFDHPFDQPPAWDQVNIGVLRAGEFDLAFIPARAWHSAGVSTLEPLQLPFVVETDEQADRVAADTELAEALLAGLDEIDVTGLGLFPEGVRHLVRLDGTPISAGSDLTGLDVRAPRSETTWQVLEELGATPHDLNGTAFINAARAGDVTAADSSLALAPGVPSAGPPSILVNIPLYTKFNVLAINQSALGRLDDATVEVLRAAAAAAVDETIRERPSQADALADACEAGLGTVFATATEREEWRDKLAPVIERITAAADMTSLLTWVRDVAGDASAQELTACPSPELADISTGQPVDPADLRPIAGDLPDGTYRFQVDEDMILETYPNLPPARLEPYRGVFTIELDGGQLTLSVVGDEGASFRYDSVYQVDGDVVTLAIPAGTDHNTLVSIRWRWTVHSDGSLSFEPFSASDRGDQVDYTDLWTISTWERID